MPWASPRREGRRLLGCRAMATKIMFENGNYVVVALDLESVAKQLGAVYRDRGGIRGLRQGARRPGDRQPRQRGLPRGLLPASSADLRAHDLRAARQLPLRSRRARRASCGTGACSTPGTRSRPAARATSVRELLELDVARAASSRRPAAKGSRSSRSSSTCRCRTPRRSSASASTTARTPRRRASSRRRRRRSSRSSANALVPSGTAVTLPAASDKVDYEAEVAFVIGRRAQEVSEADALEHVAGYTLLNDLSARDLQFATPQWMPGKVFDGSAPCGPALVTPDEAGAHDAIEIALTLNGEADAVGRRPRDLIFSVPGAGRAPLAADDARARRHRLDRDASGVGSVREPRVWLKDGRRGRRVLADARAARDDDQALAPER